MMWRELLLALSSAEKSASKQLAPHLLLHLFLKDH
jgi:hypothetical protein